MQPQSLTQKSDAEWVKDYNLLMSGLITDSQTVPIRQLRMKITTSTGQTLTNRRGTDF